MIRVTVKDPEQTISFLAKAETMFRLVAACSINPANLGQLLIAAETYQRGLAASVMAELMEFDKALKREGSAFIHEAIAEAQDKGEALAITFQVIDESTKLEALWPRNCELVVFDLNKHLITASEGLEIPASGEVTIHSGEALTEQRVTYILPQSWTIELLTG